MGNDIYNGQKSLNDDIYSKTWRLDNDIYSEHEGWMMIFVGYKF